MKIFCTDGTTVECAAFRAVDAGILVFDEEPESEEAHDEATGFVPLTQLKYVLPEDAQPGRQATRGVAQQGAAPAGPGIGGQGGGAGGTGGRAGGAGGQYGVGARQEQGAGGRQGSPGGSPPERSRSEHHP